MDSLLVLRLCSSPHWFSANLVSRERSRLNSLTFFQRLWKWDKQARLRVRILNPLPGVPSVCRFFCGGLAVSVYLTHARWPQQVKAGDFDKTEMRGKWQCVKRAFHFLHQERFFERIVPTISQSISVSHNGRASRVITANSRFWIVAERCVLTVWPLFVWVYSKKSFYFFILLLYSNTIL